jgi:hypothetical protein
VRSPSTQQHLPELVQIGPEVIPHLVQASNRRRTFSSELYRGIWVNSPAPLRKKFPEPDDPGAIVAAANRYLNGIGPAAIRANPEIFLSRAEERGTSDLQMRNSVLWLVDPQNRQSGQLLRWAGVDPAWVVDPVERMVLTHFPELQEKAWGTLLAPNSMQARYAAEMIAMFGSNAVASVDKVLECLDPQEDLAPQLENETNLPANRAAAAEALGKIGRWDDRVEAALIKAWNDEHAVVRAGAARAIGDLAGSHRNSDWARIVPELVPRLKEERDPHALSEMLRALWNIGVGSQAALPELRRLSTPQGVREQLNIVVSRTPGKTPNDLALVARLLAGRLEANTNLVPDLQRFVAQVDSVPETMELWAQAKFPKQLQLQVLEPLVTKEKELTRRSILLHHLLSRVDPSNHLAKEFFVRAISSENQNHRLRVSAANWRFKADGSTNGLAEAVMRSLQSNQDGAGQVGMQAALNAGIQAGGAREEIVRALWHPDEMVRKLAGLWLLRHHPAGLPAVDVDRLVNSATPAKRR